MRGDVQNREVAQNTNGGLDVEMSGNPDGPQQNPTEQQTARERELETPDETIVVPEAHPEPQQPQSDKQQAVSGEAVNELYRSMDTHTSKSSEPPKDGRGGQKQKNKAPGHRSTKPDPSQGAIPKTPKKNPNKKQQRKQRKYAQLRCPVPTSGCWWSIV